MPTAVYGFAWTGVEGNRTEGNQVPTHNVRIPILLTADEDGGFVVESLTMPGCISQGDTAEEAMAEIVTPPSCVRYNKRARHEIYPRLHRCG